MEGVRLLRDAAPSMAKFRDPLGQVLATDQENLPCSSNVIRTPLPSRAQQMSQPSGKGLERMLQGRRVRYQPILVSTTEGLWFR